MHWVLPVLATLMIGALGGCGPATTHASDNAACPEADLDRDVQHCGGCGAACGPGQPCVEGACQGSCQAGQTVACYDGPDESKDRGPCRGGMRMCLPSGEWSGCLGQLVPGPEVCGNRVDENCSGEADENTDADGDGYTTCGGDCCDSSECARPELVNPGAFDAAGNGVDDDCDGSLDNTAAACDVGLPSRPRDLLDYARAMELCNPTSDGSPRWGVISATLTKVDGTPGAHPDAASIRPGFGSGLPPLAGGSFALLSSGHAAAPGQTDPSHFDWEDSARNGVTSGFPADYLAAHGGALPGGTTIGCPAPLGSEAQDPVMLTLRIRVPSNARSFRFASNFFSAEFPEYVCSAYNDFFVVLLDSTWAGVPANPADKNLAFYRHPAGQVYPVGVNLARGDSGLFTQCLDGRTGCFGTTGMITTCTGTGQLAGTGFDTLSPGACDRTSLAGGATGWLVTSGNVTPGEVITLRMGIWDTSDQNLDSVVVLDSFEWSVDVSDPGTVIGRGSR